MLAMEQTIQINPTKEDRKPTNNPFIYVFSLIFFIWIGIVIKSLIDASAKKIDINDIQEADDDFRRAYEGTEGINLEDTLGWLSLRFSGTFLICTILSVLLAIAYTYLLSLNDSKFVIDIAIHLLCVFVVLVIVANAIMSALLPENTLIHFGFIPSLTYAAYLVISFRSAKNVGSKAIFEIIKDSSRALICCPPILLFVCAVSVIITLITSLSVYIFFCISLTHTGDTGNINTYLGLNFFGTMTLINFFVNFTHMVISGYTIDWFWMKDQPTSSLNLMRRSIIRTLSYHLGTLAFASIPALSYICSIFQTCWRRDNNIIKIYDIFTRFCSQVCVFVHIVEFSLIQTSIYGYDHYAAIIAAHDLVEQNNHELSLAVSEVMSVVVWIGYFFISIPFIYYHLPSFIYSTIIPFSILITSAVRALLVNKMIIDHNSEILQKERDSIQKAEKTAVSPETEAISVL